MDTQKNLSTLRGFDGLMLFNQAVYKLTLIGLLSQVLNGLRGKCQVNVYSPDSFARPSWAALDLFLHSYLLHVANAVICATARAFTCTRLRTYALCTAHMTCNLAFYFVVVEVQTIALYATPVRIISEEVASTNTVDFFHVVEAISWNECPVLFCPCVLAPITMKNNSCGLAGGYCCLCHLFNLLQNSFLTTL